MIEMLIAQAILIGANLINVKIDAYKILKTPQKNIKHAVNFAVYLFVCFMCCVLFFWEFDYWVAVFAINAFCNRQIFFDIPLNWRRGLPWDYVTPEDPPKAVLDWLEKKLVSDNGRVLVYIYATNYVLTLVFLLIYH